MSNYFDYLVTIASETPGCIGAFVFTVVQWLCSAFFCLKLDSTAIDCDVGMKVPVVAAKLKPTNDNTKVFTMQTVARNVSSSTSEMLFTSTMPAVAETPATTTSAPTNDIWNVSYGNTSMMCILLSAHITVMYNNSREVV